MAQCLQPGGKEISTSQTYQSNYYYNKIIVTVLSKV